MSKQKKKHSTTKNTHPNKAVTGTMKGRLEVTRSGLGFVIPENGTGDLLVRPGDFNTALNGDTVIAKVIKESFTTKKKKAELWKWYNADKQNL